MRTFLATRPYPAVRPAAPRGPCPCRVFRPAALLRAFLLEARGGATAVEFGVLALPFLLLVTGIMDCSRIVWAHLSLQAAVEQASRCAVVDATTCGTAAQVQAYAAAAMQGPGATSASFSYTVPSCGSQVSATMTLPIIVPGYLPASIVLTAQSCAPR